MLEDWVGVNGVDIYSITLEGCVLLHSGVPIVNSILLLSLGEDEAVSIRPQGLKPEPSALIELPS
jgi:hypothetical protein